MTEDERADLIWSAPRDKWIALSQDETRLLAEADTLDDVLEKATATGEDDPLVMRTPKEWTSLAI